MRKCLLFSLGLLFHSQAVLSMYDALLVSFDNSRPIIYHVPALGATVKDIGLDGWLEVSSALHVSRRTLGDRPSFLERRLRQIPGVKYVFRSKEKHVSQRFLWGDNDHSADFVTTTTPSPISFNDPKWSRMWYWNETNAMNIYKAWDSHRLTGDGSVVAVIDDGVDVNVQEFSGYSQELSFDYVSNVADPRPQFPQMHGTKVAGVAAAKANNNLCGLGVAHKATLVALRVLRPFGGITEARQVKSLVHNKRHEKVDVFVASWGAPDTGLALDKPEDIVHSALAKASKEGKDGFGSVVVVAAGNGGEDDDCQADGYVTDRYTLAVQAVSKYNTAPFFAEHCSAALTSVYIGTGLVAPNPGWANNQCVEDFEGTSAAAPTMAGIIALLREAYPSVTRREILHLVVHASQSHLLREGASRPLTEEARRQSSVEFTPWTTNSAGLSFNPHFGFGLIDAERLLQEAKSGRYHHPNYYEAFCNSVSVGKLDVNTAEFSTRDCENLVSLEYVTVELTVQSSERGSLEIFLTSAHGTEIRLLSKRPKDTGAEYNRWKFTTPAYWDETPIGDFNWKLKILATGGEVLVPSWSASLILYGVPHVYPTTSSTTSTTTSPTTSSTTSTTTSSTTTTTTTRNVVSTSTSRKTTMTSGSSELEITECFGEAVRYDDHRNQLMERSMDVTILLDSPVLPGTTIYTLKLWATKRGRIDLLVWEEHVRGALYVLVASRRYVSIPSAGYHEINLGSWTLPASNKALLFGFANRWRGASPVAYVESTTTNVYEKRELASNLPYQMSHIIYPSSRTQKAYSISFCTGVEVSCSGPSENIESFSYSRTGPVMYVRFVAVGSAHRNKAKFYASSLGTIYLISVSLSEGFTFKINARKPVQIDSLGAHEVDVSELSLQSQDLFGFIYYGTGATPLRQSVTGFTYDAKLLRENFLSAMSSIGQPFSLTFFKSEMETEFALKLC